MDSAGPLLIVVNGPPGAGKTTIARRLGTELRLPVLGKDDFKDVLFDVLGSRDREWSIRVGHASVLLLFMVVRRELEAGRSLVVENAFVPRFDGPRFEELSADLVFRRVQVWCSTSVDVLFERFRARALSGERHAGHGDGSLSREGFEELLRDRAYAPHLLDGLLIEVDTTSFDSIDYSSLVTAVEEAAAGSRG